VELDSLCESIIKVLGGESVVSPEMMTKLVAAFRAKSQSLAAGGAVALEADRNGGAPVPESQDDSGIALLSAREREVLTLIARGDSNKVIARKLDIAETTVKIHVQHILRKLQLSSRVQAAVYAAARERG